MKNYQEISYVKELKVIGWILITVIIPYVTSSYTLPYSACSLGFPPQVIRRIYGAAKSYDTRVGVDPDFPDSLLEDETLNKIAIVGDEFGTTTGRARKVNWLNVEGLLML